MKAFLRAERRRILDEMCHENHHEVLNAGNAALIAHYNASAEELRTAFMQLYGLQAGITSHEICHNCHSCKWRREGPSGIACAVCGMLAMSVVMSAHARAAS